MFSTFSIVGTSSDIHLSQIGFIDAKNAFLEWKSEVERNGLKVTDKKIYSPTPDNLGFGIFAIAEEVRETIVTSYIIVC